MALGFATLTLSSAGFAMSLFSHHSSSEKSTQVDILYTTKLSANSTLQPGTYQMKVALDSQEPTVKFYQSGKLVAQAEVKTIKDPTTNSTTAVSYTQEGNEHVITRIDVGGMNESLVFADSSTPTGSGT
jgi:hypothetical protein